MPTNRIDNRSENLPASFADLVRQMPPQAIMDDVHYESSLEMIDRLMAIDNLTPDQALYMETLVQLVQAYEASHYAMDDRKVGGLDTLRHLLAEHQMTASDLGRLLGVHASMGSKILKGERALTVDHLKTLAARFKIRPDAFID